MSGKEEQSQIFLPPVPGALLSLQRSISHPHGNGKRKTIWLTTEDPLHKAAQRFCLPTPKAAVPGLSLGPELAWDTWTSSPRAQFFFPAPHFFSWKWIKVIKSVLTAHLKESASLLPGQQLRMEKVGQGDPGSQQLCGQNSCRHSWAGCEEAPCGGTQVPWCWGHGFQNSLTPFLPSFLPSFPDTKSHCHYFHHFPSTFQKSQHRI